MDRDKEVDFGCDGSCGCRSKSGSEGSENASGCDANTNAGSLGESLAAGAIIEMDNAKKDNGKGWHDEITEANVDGFIEKCEKEGKNPIDVVEFIAKINGIEIFSECEPKDASKRGLYELLKCVVKKVLIGLLSDYADKYGLEFIKSLIESCVSFRELDKSSRSSGNGSDVCADVRKVSVRMIPVRLGYAFTW